MQSNERVKGSLLTLLGGIGWGISGSVGQYLFSHEGMDSRWLVPLRLGLAGIILLAYSAFRWPKTFLSPWKEGRDRAELLVYGLLGISCCQFFYFLTIQLSSATIATILQDLSPVFILMVTCLLSRRRPGLREILSIFLALAGVFFLTAHGDFSHLAIRPEALIAGLLSAVCVTIYNVEPKRLLSRYPISLLQGWAFLSGAVMFALIFRPWQISYAPTPTGCLGIAAVVIIGNVLAFTSYMKGIALIGPEKGILFGFSEPLTAALIAVAFLQAAVTVWDVLGFACVFAMLVLITKKS